MSGEGYGKSSGETTIKFDGKVALITGVMRAVLIERCAAATEASLRVADLLAADAVFLSDSLGLRTLASLNGLPLGARPDRVQDVARQGMSE